METEIVSPGYHFFSFVLRLPVGGRHQSLHLVRQVDVRLDAEAEQRRPLVDAVDAEHVADGVEVDVARLLDGVAQVNRAVPFLLLAFEVAAVEGLAAAAVHAEVRLDDALFQAGQSDGHLEDGSRGVPSLQRAVLQRLQRSVFSEAQAARSMPAAKAFGS